MNVSAGIIAGEESPLSKVIEGDKAFYDLFIDFKGYVDFFFCRIVFQKAIPPLISGWEMHPSGKEGCLKQWRIISSSSLKNISSWTRGIEGYRIIAKQKNGLEPSNVILEVADDLCHGCQMSEFSHHRDED